MALKLQFDISVIVELETFADSSFTCKAACLFHGQTNNLFLLTDAFYTVGSHGFFGITKLLLLPLDQLTKISQKTDKVFLLKSSQISNFLAPLTLRYTYQKVQLKRVHIRKLIQTKQASMCPRHMRCSFSATAGDIHNSARFSMNALQNNSERILNE